MRSNKFKWFIIDENKSFITLKCIQQVRTLIYFNLIIVVIVVVVAAAAAMHSNTLLCILVLYCYIIWKFELFYYNYVKIMFNMSFIFVYL